MPNTRVGFIYQYSDYCSSLPDAFAMLFRGIITRKTYASVLPEVEYSLTPLGQILSGFLAAIGVWAESHIDAILEAQAEYDRRVIRKVDFMPM